MTRLTLIRHAPILHDAGGPVLCGRTDRPADLSDGPGLARLGRALPQGAAVLCSPALRARQTAAALGLAAKATDARLWEQDFGAWEGLPPDRLPDLGPLPPDDLARQRPPGGESFADLCARVWPLLAAIQTDTIIIAHAGVIRAALAQALDSPAAGLAFRIDAPSLTELARDGTDWTICRVNLSF
ncbi:histidine phosphatase family protein [Paracoccus sp. p4-l81]|uniref:histidine phosphatase family protein n=1 Tax=Paracoccus sp. p4-l81 TaxID=3342806 RepID=UPI0035B7A640